MHCSRAAEAAKAANAARRRRAGAGRATSSRWKSRSSFTSGLLARSTEAQPLNAPSPSVPVRPLIMTTEPLSRTSALAESGLCNRPGASSVRSTGMFCRSSGGAGAVALISNLSGCSPARALPVTLILRSAPITASALMPSMRLSTRSRRLENTMVPSVTVTRSIASAFGVGFAGRRRRLGGRRRLRGAFAQQRDIQHRTDRSTSSVICG